MQNYDAKSHNNSKDVLDCIRIYSEYQNIPLLAKIAKGFDL